MHSGYSRGLRSSAAFRGAPRKEAPGPLWALKVFALGAGLLLLITGGWSTLWGPYASVAFLAGVLALTLSTMLACHLGADYQRGNPLEY